MILREKILTNKDSKDIMKLFYQSKDFFKKTLGFMPRDCYDLLNEVPKGARNADKRVFGFFDDDNELTGICDVLDGYPEETTATIGFLLVRPDARRQHIGSVIMERIEALARKRGINKLRAIYEETNTKAAEFFASHSFVITEEAIRHQSNDMLKLIFVTKDLLTQDTQ